MNSASTANGPDPGEQPQFLGAASLRQLAEALDLRPTKRWGQNFVHDANTVRRIVDAAGLTSADTVLEVGPGLGSLTLGLLPAAHAVIALEVDPALAAALPATVRDRAPELAGKLSVQQADALRVHAADLPARPTAMVANLPYNVAVPVLLHLLAELPELRTVLVMVQAEVAERLVAAPGSRRYAAPSAKLAWYASSRWAGAVPRSVFWPVPNVDSGLVALRRHPAPGPESLRRASFTVIEHAFAQRRKMLRTALAEWAGSSRRASQLLEAAGLDPTTRAERLSIQQFTDIAVARSAEPE